ncbi:hypothetical protein [Dyadobacter sp. 50-39]|uniref:hypothetical protein n=1 Tax=Dyadobacter sp. 50-39 TaxID=1895756 RepID=UPI000B1C33F5|nr:hypothetical protein [Dyadobacter sp. 50-39]
MRSPADVNCRREPSVSDGILRHESTSQKLIRAAREAFLNGDSLYILKYSTQYVEITTQSSVTYLSVEPRLDKES